MSGFLARYGINIIEHASRLVTTMDKTTTTSSSNTTVATSGPYKSASIATLKMMGQIRASLAVMRVLQYLDSIQNVLLLTDREQLDTKLERLLDQVVDHHHQECNNNKRLIQQTFRISPWMQSPRLALDIVVGESALYDDASSLLSIRVDPVWQVHVEDLIMYRQSVDDHHHHQDDDDNTKTTAISALHTTNCALTILKVAYTTPTSSSSSSACGRTGQALVKVRVSPLLPAPKLLLAKKQKTPVWGDDQEVMRKIRVQESRVIQLNADPPIPKSNVDLYESSVYGTSDATVTLLVPTYATSHDNDDETPNVHIELIVAFDE